MKTVEVLLGIAPRLHVPREELLRAGGLNEQDFKKQSTATWGQLVRVLRRASELAGGSLELERLSEMGPKMSENAWFSSLMGYFASAKAIYWALVRFYVPKLFPAMTVTYRETTRDTVLIEMRVPESFEGCPEAFHVWAGAFRAAPGLLGQINATVKSEISPHGAVYTITCPPALTLFSRIARAKQAFQAGRNAIELLSEQEKQLREHHAERFRAERALLEQEVKLKLSTELAGLAKMSALGEMAAGIAHEINNSLAVIDPRASVMLKSLEKGEVDSRALQEGLEAIRATAGRMAKIVGGLRAYAAKDADRALESCTVTSILQGTLPLCAERLKAAGIRVEVDTGRPGLSAVCQAVQISQVLLNLINNSIDALAPLPEKWIRVSVADLANGVEIAIEDSGPGIAKELQENIFKPFFTTKGPGRGTGLGLSISRGLVEAHGGSLTLDTLASHTRFVIWISNRPGASWP